jgi:hypothetical protein
MLSRFCHAVWLAATRRKGTRLMARFEFSRLRKRTIPTAGDATDQARKVWQVLLEPFSLRPPDPARQPAKPRPGRQPVPPR